MIAVSAYFIFIKKSQSNVLFGSISLLATDFLSGIIAKQIFILLQRNGWSRDNFTIIAIYLIVIVILWGILYAILSNFYFRVLDNYAKILSIFSALIFSAAFSMAVCFLVSNATKTDGIYVCRQCQKIPVFYLPQNDKKIYVPKNLQEAYLLPDDTRVILQDSIGQKSILNLINQDRLANGKQPLAENDRLEDLSKVYAQSIVYSLRFSHVDSNNDGPEERARRLNISYNFLGENLAIAPDYQTAHISLMNSPTHRQNILSGKFKKVGIASYLLSTGSIIVVEEFSD